MYIPKRYGQSKVENCPFCNKQAVTHNPQGVSVCANHKNEKINEIKCMCGSWLEIKSGKFGPYFHCFKCGNVNFKKGLEMNPIKKVEKKAPEQRKETTITSDDIGIYY